MTGDQMKCLYRALNTQKINVAHSVVGWAGHTLLQALCYLNIIGSYERTGKCIPCLQMADVVLFLGDKTGTRRQSYLNLIF